MKLDRLKVYLFEIVLVITLLISIILSSYITRIILAILMIGLLILLNSLLKKRNMSSVFSKEVLIWMFIFALVYLGVYYLLGLYFGFVNNPYMLSSFSFKEFIFPITIIVICSELIRKVLLSQKLIVHIKAIEVNLSNILTFISMVLVDLYIYTGSLAINKLDDFLIIIGFVLFASISCNLLYNYIANRYGSKGILVYRLITILYAYIFPVVPNVYIFLRSFLRMLYPYLIYVFLERNYAKSVKQIPKKKDRLKMIIDGIIIVISILYIMLISCKFKYCLLVIGTRSMTGTINVGDAIVYESYDDQKIENGQVVVFNYNGMTTIHRVVNIKRINGEIRYFTKGDANNKNDNGYRINDDIIGLVDLRIKYIGYPTIWLNNLFKK